jgi:hypothetical protein
MTISAFGCSLMGACLVVILKSDFMKTGQNLQCTRGISRKPDDFYHAAQLRCQYPQKSTLGLFFMTSATTRSTWEPFGSLR